MRLWNILKSAPIDTDIQLRLSARAPLRKKTSFIYSKLYPFFCKNPVFRIFSFKPIPYHSRFIIEWNRLILIIHLFNIFMFPLCMAWTEHFVSFYWLAIAVVIDFMHLFDVFFHCLLCFKDSYGHNVSNLKIISKRYLFNSHGWITLLMSIPWELFAFLPVKTSGGVVPIVFMQGKEQDTLFYQFKVAAIINCIKMLLRLPYSRIESLSIPGMDVNYSRLLKTIIILMVLGHVDACIFWAMELMLPADGNRWIDSQALMYYVNAFGVVETVSFSTQYLVSYINALRALVLKLRHVRLDNENIYVIFEFIAGILSYGTVFGTIHSILEIVDKNAASSKAHARHTFLIRNLKDYMKKKSFPQSLQKSIITIKEMDWARSRGVDELHMFDDLPKQTQQDIKNFLYLDLVKKVIWFDGLHDAFFNHLTFKLRPLYLLDGSIVFKKDDDGDEMYFVKSGKIEIIVNEDVIYKINHGSYFGEIALFEDGKRQATAKAVGECELLTLSKKHFKEILEIYPMIADRIKETTLERKEEAEEAIRRMEQKVSGSSNRLNTTVSKIFKGGVDFVKSFRSGPITARKGSKEKRPSPLRAHKPLFRDDDDNDSQDNNNIQDTKDVESEATESPVKSTEQGVFFKP